MSFFLWLLVTLANVAISSVFAVDAPSCRTRWCQQPVAVCLNESLASNAFKAPSLRVCLLKASSSVDSDSLLLDDAMLQWNNRTGVCSLYDYQRVCLGIVNNQSVSTCWLYRTAALDSCEAQRNLLNDVGENNLLGIWLAGGRSRFGNLACQTDPSNHRMEPFNLQWTDEGALFSGVSSYAVLKDPRFVSPDTSIGFTWLLRLKREPRSQPFMEATSCTGSVIGPHFWEYPAANYLYFSRLGFKVEPANFRIHSSSGVLPSDSNAWINLAMSFGSSASNSGMFYNSSFVSHALFTPNFAPQQSCYHLLVGSRHNINTYLKGTVRAVAIYNATMTEQQIRDFFATIS